MNQYDKFSPFSFGAHESVIIRSGDTLKVWGMEDAYENCPNEEIVLDEDNEVIAKYPRKWTIFDRGGNFTKVKRVLRKRRKTNLLMLQVRGSENMIVTEDHPLIISNDSENVVPAGESKGLKQYRSNMHAVSNFSDEIQYIKNKALKNDMYNTYRYEIVSGALQMCKSLIDLEDLSAYDGFGWFIGLLLSSGKLLVEEYTHNVYGVTILHTNKDYLERAAIGLYGATGIPGSIEKVSRWNLLVYRLTILSKALSELLLNEFRMSKDPVNPNLPEDILNYPELFQKGILNGFLAGENDNKRARKLMTQIAMLARINGIDGYMESTLESGSLRSAFVPHLKRDPYGGIAVGEGDWNLIDSVNVIKNTAYLKTNTWVYDITTESHSFLLNNIWVHNCGGGEN